MPYRADEAFEALPAVPGPPPAMKRYRRRNKLPKPSLQLRLTATFMGTLALSIFLQLMLTRTAMLELALQLPNDGQLLLQEINATQVGILLACCVLLLPVCFLVGVLSTFRIAGPLYRFEDHLRRLARGEDPGPCRLRQGDQLMDFCELLNVATEPLRELNAANSNPPQTPEGASTEEPAAPLSGAKSSESSSVGSRA
jgi:hypothetical protein